MNKSRNVSAVLIVAAATAVSVGLAAPANATCNKKCQTIQNELKKADAALESGKLTKHQTALTTTRIKDLTFWIANYDEQTKQWYSTGLPNLPAGERVSTGIVSGKTNPELDINLDGQPVYGGIDPYLYKVVTSVTPEPLP